MSILHYLFMDRTALSVSTKHASSLALFVGIGALVSGFLLHAIAGQPGQTSLGTLFGLAGAVPDGLSAHRPGVRSDHDTRG